MIKFQKKKNIYEYDENIIYFFQKKTFYYTYKKNFFFYFSKKIILFNIFSKYRGKDKIFTLEMNHLKV
jgi:hypothetical protein